VIADTWNLPDSRCVTRLTICARLRTIERNFDSLLELKREQCGLYSAALDKRLDKLNARALRLGARLRGLK
jgi:hypothetical protein